MTNEFLGAAVVGGGEDAVVVVVDAVVVVIEAETAAAAIMSVVPFELLSLNWYSYPFPFVRRSLLLVHN